jgi:putative ABC transport system ATP-binding protein
MSPVSVRQLTKTYGQGDFAVGAVRHVDLDIAAGEVVLIMGPSRSGKTTLLMLGAMLRPTSGSITVDGIDLATAAERDLPPLRARQFGFIFQDFNLLSALDVVEKVELACNVAGVTSRAANERATALLNRLGLGARLLRQIATEDGRSVVIVSHDQRLKEIADRVLWLEDGEFRQLAAMATDPVCGMAVETGDGPHQELDGRTFWFCSTHCRDEFRAMPGRFTRGGENAHSITGG